MDVPSVNKPATCHMLYVQRVARATSQQLISWYKLQRLFSFKYCSFWRSQCDQPSSFKEIISVTPKTYLIFLIIYVYIFFAIIFLWEFTYVMQIKTLSQLQLQLLIVELAVGQCDPQKVLQNVYWQIKHIFFILFPFLPVFQLQWVIAQEIATDASNGACVAT